MSPYRPVTDGTYPYEPHLQAFDWIEAVRMLAASVRRSCGCETYVITDAETWLPVPSIALPTTESRLMLWILDVSLRFLESRRFNQDTIFVSPDTLVVGSLAEYFEGDLTVIVRSDPKHRARPIINSVQWWPLAARDRLVAFYARALEIARDLPEEILAWGADSEPFRHLLSPIVPGRYLRSGLDVRMLEMTTVMESLRKIDIDALDRGQTPQRPSTPLVDFRFTRKLYMPAYYRAVVAA